MDSSVEYGYRLLHGLSSCILIYKTNEILIFLLISMLITLLAQAPNIDDVWSHDRLSHDLYGKI